LSLSTPLLGLGLVLAGVGVLLLLLSFRSTEEIGEVEHRAAGVVFIGPIPIVWGGRGRWALVGIVVVVVIFLILVFAMAQPELIGW
jgi:uncharacterized protein (TIGR00304 family)